MSRGAGRTTEMSPPTTNGAPKPAPARVKRIVKNTDDRVSCGDKHLEWVPIARMQVSDVAQRRHNSAASRAKIMDIAANFDPDKFGTLTVNLRDGIYWVIDGGHRYNGLLELGWEDQLVQCWTYEGLSEAQEADKFLALNDVKAVSGMDKFKQGVIAGRPIETDIDRIVRSADLHVSNSRDGVGCVGALTKIYNQGGPSTLAATLRVLRDSFGIPGFAAKVTEGIGLFISRYGVKNVNEDVLVARLAAKKGGVVGLLGEAERVRIKYGVSLAEAVAAAATDTYNRGKTGPRLATWWSQYSVSN